MTEKETTPEQATREVKGSIGYTLKQFPNGDWELDYERSIENEMAAMSIAQYIMEHAVATARLGKKKEKGKLKQLISKHLEKYIQAQMGIRILADNIFSAYDSFMEQQAKHEKDMLTAEVSKKDQELLKGMMDGNK